MRTISNTLFIGKVLHWLGDVDSTNRWLQEYIVSENPAEGVVVVADHQQAGKGQQGAVWESEPGENLLMSVLLKPSFLQASNFFVCNKAIALAVCATVQELTDEPVFVKWPNDIYVRQKKIAGILIESSLQGNTIKNCIAGIGINVNQSFTTSALQNAISLAELKGSTLDRQMVLEILCTKLEKFYLLLKAGNENSIEEMYHTHLYKRDTITKFIRANEIIVGKIEKVDTAGKLNVMTDKGLRIFDVKEIQFS